MTTMGGSLQVAAGMVTLATLGIGTAWLLARRKGPARGWCARCNAPNLWNCPKETPSSKAYAMAAGTLCTAAVVMICLAVAVGGSEWKDILAGTGLLLAITALLHAAVSRSRQVRVVRCDTCGAEYPSPVPAVPPGSQKKSPMSADADRL